MARSEAPASAKAAGNGYPLRLPPPRQSSTLLACQTPFPWSGFHLSKLSEFQGPPLRELCINRSTFYTWYHRYTTQGRAGLEPKPFSGSWSITGSSVP